MSGVNLPFPIELPWPYHQCDYCSLAARGYENQLVPKDSHIIFYDTKEELDQHIMAAHPREWAQMEVRHRLNDRESFPSDIASRPPNLRHQAPSLPVFSQASALSSHGAPNIRHERIKNSRVSEVASKSQLVKRTISEDNTGRESSRKRLMLVALVGKRPEGSKPAKSVKMTLSEPLKTGSSGPQYARPVHFPVDIQEPERNDDTLLDSNIPTDGSSRLSAADPMDTLEFKLMLKGNEYNELLAQNRSLKEENSRSRAFIERLLRHESFTPFLEDLQKPPPPTFPPENYHDSQKREPIHNDLLPELFRHTIGNVTGHGALIQGLVGSNYSGLTK